MDDKKYIWSFLVGKFLFQRIQYVHCENLKNKRRKMFRHFYHRENPLFSFFFLFFQVIREIRHDSIGKGIFLRYELCLMGMLSIEFSYRYTSKLLLFGYGFLKNYRNKYCSILRWSLVRNIPHTNHCEYLDLREVVKFLKYYYIYNFKDQLIT